LCELQRLQAKIIKLVDVSYGGENGFNQAIELAAESLQNVKFIQEKKLIGNIILVPTYAHLNMCKEILSE
jgi:peptide subunit release factor 1 (eRF1)